MSFQRLSADRACRLAEGSPYIGRLLGEELKYRSALRLILSNEGGRTLRLFLHRYHLGSFVRDLENLIVRDERAQRPVQGHE